MLNNRRFKLLSQSLDAVNLENDKLKKGIASLESINQKQVERINYLQSQLNSIDSDKELRKRIRQQDKEINRLEIHIKRLEDSRAAIHEKLRHAFEMTRPVKR